MPNLHIENLNFPFVIGFGHKKGHGKDTLADLLIERYPNKFLKVAFADKLKKIAVLSFGFTQEQIFGNLKEVVDPRWEKSPRECMQLLGTEMFRNVIDSNFWVKSLFLDLQLIPKNKIVLITDTRFHNEANAIKETGGLVFRVHRPDMPTNEFSNHISETALDNYPWDGNIINDSTPEAMLREIFFFFKQRGVNVEN